MSAGLPQGVTIVELLVVAAVLCMIVCLVLPAVLSARDAAHRNQCRANLRSMGQGLLAYESGKGSLPAGRDQTDLGEDRSVEIAYRQDDFADHSWATAILPFLDEQALFDRYDWRRPWNHDPQQPEAEGNLHAAQTRLPVFLCPTTGNPTPGGIDYGGNYGSALTGLEKSFAPGAAWDSGVLLTVHLPYTDQTRRRGVRVAHISDGTSHTLMVMEDAGRPREQGGMWASGHNCFAHDRGSINRHRSNEIFSDHPGIAHVLLADGSVAVLSEDVEPRVLGAMCTRAGREAVAADNL